MISFSEIETTVKRATRSVGFSWGISEEVGKNIRLLEMFGLPGVKNINKYFKIYNVENADKISEHSIIYDKNNEFSFPTSLAKINDYFYFWCDINVATLLQKCHDLLVTFGPTHP